MNTISVLSSDVHCRACDGTGVFIPVEFLELERDVTDVLAHFPVPDIMGKGQWFFRPRTIVRTLAYMFQKGDVEGRRIACLATPTMSVGLACLQRKANLNLSVTVFDIDDDILRVIKQHFDSVEVRKYDISEECPTDSSGNFDCFIFDPLYAEDHYRIGLSRCIQLIGSHRPDKVGYVIVPPEEIAPIRTLREGKRIPIQLVVFGFLNEMGLCIADFKDNFMEYETPLAEVGILRQRANRVFSQDFFGEWRGSDLVRVVSTFNTHATVEGDTILTKRVNDRKRVGASQAFVPLDEIAPDAYPCRMCIKCFSTYPDDQRQHYYTNYWHPEILIRPMPSWRAEDDQPFEVGAACAGFENTQTGEIVVLRGPASKAIWEMMRDLEQELGEVLVAEEILSKSLPDYSCLDLDETLRDTTTFLDDLMKAGLIHRRRVILQGGSKA